MPRKQRTWIVIADGSHARIYERLGRANDITLVSEREDPEARKRTSDLVSDTRGRNTGGAGGPHHAMELKVTPHQHLEDVFVRSLAREIDEAMNERKFERLILAIPPKALGAMRAALSPGARERVIAEFNKELVSLSAKDLLAYIDDQMP